MDINIKEEIDAIRYQIENAKREQGYTLLLENESTKKYILSKYTPKQDALKLIEGKIKNKQMVFVLFGFLFGYVRDYILEQVGESANIIIIEPDENLFKAQLEVIGETKKSQCNNINIFSGTNLTEIETIIENNISLHEANNINFILAPYYTEYYAAYYRNIIEKILQRREDLLLSHNTRRVFDSLLIKNMLKNRYKINNTYDICQHKDRYNKIPAVIVSAGPSLENNIQYIKRFKGAVFTGGRSLTAVLKQGIKPDFVVSIDPQDETYYTFQENGINSIPLITVPEGNSLVVENNHGPQYFLGGNPIQNHLLGRDFERVSMGGSVATLCLSAAYYMGFDPIIFIGQDFAFTGNKTHADNCAIRTNDIDTDPGKYKVIKGYYGNDVISDVSLVNYLRWFEKFINQNSDRQYINATEGGAHIEGAQKNPFRDVVEQFSKEDKIKIDHVKDENQEKDVDEHIKEVLKVLEETNELAKQGLRLSKKLLEEYDIYRGIRENKIQGLIKKISLVDEKIMLQQKEKNIVNIIFSGVYDYINMIPDYKEKLNETSVQKDKRIVHLNLATYQVLKNSVYDTIKNIKDNL